MKEINAYQCSDGKIFEDKKKAQAHEEDLLGQELDGLLRLFQLDITRNQEFSGILSAMKSKKELLSTANSIIDILQHGDISINDIEWE